MKTLRQHVAAARAVLKDFGYRSSFPEGGKPSREKKSKREKRKDPSPAPLYQTTLRSGKKLRSLPGSPTRAWMRHPHQKNSVSDRGERLLVYAISVIRVIERFDRTGWVVEWLSASDELAGEVWEKIPQHPVCPLCLGRVGIPGHQRRVHCVPCGTSVEPRTLRGLAKADIAKMTDALSKGLIPCELPLEDVLELGAEYGGRR